VDQDRRQFEIARRVPLREEPQVSADILFCNLRLRGICRQSTALYDMLDRAAEEIEMPEAEIGWIAAIIIGGLAGWLAEMLMKSGTGIFTNIILGIIGAALANWLLGLFGIALGGWLGYLVAGFIGACIIIFLWRAIRGRRT
jgi:uncharacterized membrane protein YeaQ/YmgE (transglycosylase-associated protein family)